MVEYFGVILSLLGSYFAGIWGNLSSKRGIPMRTDAPFGKLKIFPAIETVETDKDLL